MEHPGLSEVNLIAAIADLKHVDYQNTLAISALIELLVERGILTKRDFTEKAVQLDEDSLLSSMRRAAAP